MSTIRTFSNVEMNPIDPHPDEVNVIDIAHALSMMTRANGHLKIFYSVAQHSVNCAHEAAARHLSQKIQLACLLHDASEAYLSDITRPVKAQFPQYLVFEERMQGVVWEVFGLSGLTPTEHEAVREIDNALLHHEFLELHGTRVYSEEPALASRPDFTERPHVDVEQAFLLLFESLIK